MPLGMPIVGFVGLHANIVSLLHKIMWHQSDCSILITSQTTHKFRCSYAHSFPIFHIYMYTVAQSWHSPIKSHADPTEHIRKCISVVGKELGYTALKPGVPFMRSWHPVTSNTHATQS